MISYRENPKADQLRKCLTFKEVRMSCQETDFHDFALGRNDQGLRK